MRVFLLDLWLDLKAKRLAPVALALLAGIIAVPIVLAKSNNQTAPPPPTATTAAAPAGPVVESQAQTTAADSKLQTFSARDPFEPTKVAVAPTGATTPSSGSTGTSTTPATTGNGTTGGGSTPGGGTGNGTTGNGNTGNTTPETKTTLFTYTADVKFGQAGDMKTYAAVKRLEMLPDQQTPKIVFLGVTTTAKTAVFLVDNNLGVDTGEGRCKPSPDSCQFLYLRPDKAHDEAILTDTDGTVYHVRLLGINRVTVSSANGTTGTGNSGNGKSGNGKAKSKAFTGTATSSDGTPPGETTPPGEPAKPSSSFQQFFADSGN
jgi:hypothetical protein